MTTLNIESSLHYRKAHRKDIPWSLAVNTILTGKMKRKGRDLIEFTSKSQKQNIYVLCKEEKNKLIVINAKRQKVD